ncbi:MAG: hypothetical protein EBX67_07570 [Betaproteobacteria bacterium]|nr:hypothetical protein [Betaproteobacteria bacterium]
MAPVSAGAFVYLDAPMKRVTLLNAIHFLQRVVVRGDDEALLIRTVEELQHELNKTNHKKPSSKNTTEA